VVGHKRLFTVALTVLALAAPGCGGDGDDDGAQPLALNERVARAGDLDQYKPRDGERLKTVETAVEHFGAIFTGPADPAKEELAARLKRAGFVAGYDTELFKGFGAEGGSLVLQLGSGEGAKATVDWIFRQALKPCPGVCDVQIQTVEVSDVPGARALHRFRAKTSEQGQPFEIYLVSFADGPFVYGIAVNGPPKTIEESDFVHAAERLYDRVKGHPPA
jgi:hypothetical protein